MTGALILQGLAAVGVRDAAYLTAPIGSGLREIHLMVKLDEFDRDALRRSHGELWRDEVLVPNIHAARRVAAVLRRNSRGPVVDPSHFDIPGFTQQQYDKLCASVIRMYCDRVILGNGWEFSRGSRVELSFAYSYKLQVVTAEGLTLTALDAEERLRAAQLTAQTIGVPSELVESVLPLPSL